MRTKPSRLRPSLKKLALSSAGLGPLSFRTGLFGSALGNTVPDATSHTFYVRPATPNDDTPVFNWNSSGTRQIRASEFYVTDNPDSTIPLESFDLDQGETRIFYLIGLLQPVISSTVGFEMEITNTDGVLTYSYIGQMFRGGEVDWFNKTYNQLVNNTSSVGIFNSSHADYVFSNEVIST